MSDPQRRTAGPFRVAGFVNRASNDDPSPIAALWQTFGERFAELNVQAGPCAVYHDYESDHTAPYSLLVGLPADEDTALPDGWTSVEVPRADYLVFPVPEGPMPGVLIETWQRIWTHFDESAEYERAYTVDFEQHGPVTEVFIAVRPR